VHPVIKEASSSRPKYNKIKAGPFPYHRNYSGTFLYADVFKLQNKYKGKSFERLDPWLFVSDLYSRFIWGVPLLYEIHPFTTHGLANLLSNTTDCPEWRYKNLNTHKECSSQYTKSFYFRNMKDRFREKELSSYETSVYAIGNVPISYAFEESFCKLNTSTSVPTIDKSLTVSVNTRERPVRDHDIYPLFKRLLADIVSTNSNGLFSTVAETFKNKYPTVYRQLQTAISVGDYILQVQDKYQEKLTFPKIREIISLHPASFDQYIVQLFQASGKWSDLRQNLQTHILLHAPESQFMYAIIKRTFKPSSKKGKTVLTRLSLIHDKRVHEALHSTMTYTKKDLKYDIDNGDIFLEGDTNIEEIITNLRSTVCNKILAHTPGTVFRIDSKFLDDLLATYKTLRAGDIILTKNKYTEWSKNNVDRLQCIKTSHDVPNICTYVVTDSSTTDFGAPETEVINFIGYKHVIVNKKHHNHNLTSPIETHFKQLRIMLQLCHQSKSIFNRNATTSFPTLPLQQNQDTFEFSENDIQRILRIKNSCVNTSTGQKPADLWMQAQYYNYNKKWNKNYIHEQVVIPKNPSFSYNSMLSYYPCGTLVDIVHRDPDIGNHTGLRKLSRLMVVGHTNTSVELLAPDNSDSKNTQIIGKRSLYGEPPHNIRLLDITYVPYRLTHVVVNRRFTKNSVKTYIRVQDSVLSHRDSNDVWHIESNVHFLIPPANVEGFIKSFHGLFVMIESLHLENPIVSRFDVQAVVPKISYKKRNIL